MEKKKKTSKIDFNKIKEILLDIFKKVGSFVKKLVLLIKKLKAFNYEHIYSKSNRREMLEL